MQVRDKGPHQAAHVYAGIVPVIVVFKCDRSLQDGGRHFAQRHVGTVTAEGAGVYALVEKVLACAVVESDGLELFLLAFDDAGVGKLCGVEGIDAEDAGNGHADRAANGQEYGEKKGCRPL